MTDYKPYHFKEADVCDCKHVRGSHAGKHFGLVMGFMAVGMGTMLPLSYLAKANIIPEWLSAFLWGGVFMPVTIYLGMFRLDKGCSFCSCKKFHLVRD